MSERPKQGAERRGRRRPPSLWSRCYLRQSESPARGSSSPSRNGLKIAASAIGSALCMHCMHCIHCIQQPVQQYCCTRWEALYRLQFVKHAQPVQYCCTRWEALYRLQFVKHAPCNRAIPSSLRLSRRSCYSAGWRSHRAVRSARSSEASGFGRTGAAFPASDDGRKRDACCAAMDPPAIPLERNEAARRCPYPPSQARRPPCDGIGLLCAQ